MTYTSIPVRFEIYDDSKRELAAKINAQGDGFASTIEIRTCVNPDNWPDLADTITQTLLKMHPRKK